MLPAGKLDEVELLVVAGGCLYYRKHYLLLTGKCMFKFLTLVESGAPSVSSVLPVIKQNNFCKFRK